MTQSPNQSTWNVPQQNAQDTGCNYTSWAKTGASVLGGLGIGALLMYLFDPEEGQQRRGYLTEAASDLASRAGSTLGSAWESASDTASDLGDRASSALSSRRTRGLFSGLFSRARDTASDWADSASDWLPDRRTLSRARKYLPARDEGFDTSSLLLTAAGAFALGAMMMFTFDPQSGRRRRALARDKAYSAARQTGEYVEKKARHYSNVAKGVYHEAAGAVSEATGSESGRPAQTTGLNTNM